MASDGLWDEMKKDRIAEIVQENKSDKTKIVSELLNQALIHAASVAKLSLKELADLQAGGARRDLHDDITVICVDLQD